jgi:hypothetical protein
VGKEVVNSLLLQGPYQGRMDELWERMVLSVSFFKYSIGREARGDVARISPGLKDFIYGHEKHSQK